MLIPPTFDQLRFTLAHLQYDVLMTDVPFILSSVLLPNVRRNTAALLAGPSGRLQARELDWTVPSSAWTWNSPSTTSITSDWTDPSRRPSEQQAEPVTPPFDLILTTDTIYVPELLDALLDTLRSLSLLSSSPPPILLALERRDSALVDASLAKARAGGFECGMVNKSRTAKSVERHLAWEREDWDSVEIWKMRYKPSVCVRVCCGGSQDGTSCQGLPDRDGSASCEFSAPFERPNSRRAFMCRTRPTLCAFDCLA